MKRETDLQAVISLAHTFLMFEPQKTEYSPIVVKHPLIDTGIVAFRKPDGSITTGNILESKESLNAWRNMIRKILDETKTALQVFFYVTKSYLLGFLKYAVPYLSREDFSQMLVDAWTRSESPNNDPNLSKSELLSMFKSADLTILMSDSERDLLASLDETVTVYRGVTSHNANNVHALSWTLDRKVAEWFAHRFHEEGVVYEARIKREDIVAIFTARGESEVVVDPARLHDITEVPSMTESMEQSDFA